MQWSLFLLILMGQCSFFTCQLFEYHFVNKSETWNNAQAVCKNNYTNLATVPNRSYMEKLLQSEQNHTEAWIGLQNKPDNTRWHWSLPGVKLIDAELQWFEVKPEENCMTMKSTDPLKGRTHPCVQNYTFICYSEQNETGQNFHLIQMKKTWQEAQNVCRENYTDLVSGLEQIKDSEIKSLMETVNEHVWIGLLRDAWSWSDGRNYGYRNWESVPKEAISYNSCAMLKESGKWGHDDCAVAKPFFCYFDESSFHDKLVLIKENKTWEDALEYCRAHHHDLVSITEWNEQKRAQIWVQKREMANTSYVWLGLRYSCPLDLWFWVSDKLMCYENWASGKRPYEECDVAVAMGKDGRWYKRNETEKLNFFCTTW